MEIRRVQYSGDAIHAFPASEKLLQNSCKIKDEMSSCKECKIQTCCSGIGNFFGKVWSGIVHFFKWLFCCNSTKEETFTINGNEFRVLIDRDKAVVELFDPVEGDGLEVQENDAFDTINSWCNQEKEMLEVMDQLKGIVQKHFPDKKPKVIFHSDRLTKLTKINF